MFYRPQHGCRASWLKRGLIGFAILGTATTGGAFAASSASAAAPVTPMINNGPSGPGEAGYFVNDNGSTKIRDVMADLVVTNTLENLNGTSGTSSTVPGGVGVELCNDNTGYAAQLGVEWTGTNFVVAYGDSTTAPLGDLTTTQVSNADTDPCVEGGLLYPTTIGPTFTNFLNASPASSVGAIHVGDTLHFEIYYDPRAKHHTLKFLVRDVTQNITRVQTVKIPAQDFYEAGIGVLTENQSLTGGAVNLINTFTNTYFNWYGNKSAAPASILNSHWDTESADFINGSNQVTVTPAALNASGTSFQMLEGSTSA